MLLNKEAPHVERIALWTEAVQENVLRKDDRHRTFLDNTRRHLVW
jgi:hypothetical protein